MEHVWRAENNLWKLVISFHYVGSEAQTQVVQLGSPCSLNHLAGPGHFSYPNLVGEGLRHKVFS